MNRSSFEEYLACFNTRDYDRAKDYFADDIVLKFAGYEIVGKEGFSRFYEFFHHYVDEEVMIHQFAGDEENVIIDVKVRLEAKQDLTLEILAEKGYERLGALNQGDMREIPQFIHYRIEDGKFKEIRCVIKE
jgi:hypothetical protein